MTPVTMEKTVKDADKFVRKRIGNTVYTVSVHFNRKSSESIGDKIIRLAKYDAERLTEGIDNEVGD